jgi:hypothetical protein
MQYVLQFVAAELVADGCYDDRPVWKANLVAGLAVYVARNPDWPTLATPSAPAGVFRANLVRCGVGSGGPR